MAASRVLKVPQSDDKEFVLLQVSSSGKKPLDLKLVGTEGEAPYVVKIKHDRISALKVKNSQLTDAEWETTLESFFNQKPLNDIHATATVQSEVSISITIRKEVQGITQRLGAITLSHDANEAIELLEWCAASADAVVASNEATAQARSRATELEAAIHQLRDQLEELLRAKDEDETALLQKFRDLLNEKKIKIREQQKVLASGSFSMTKQEEQPAEPSPPPEPKAAKAKGRGRKPAASRAGKRKAAAPAKEESDDEDAVEADVAQVPRIKTEPEDTDEGHTTEATASVDGDDDSDEEMEDGDAEDGETAATPPPREPSPPKKAATPPPKRALPFVNRKPKEASKTAVPAAGEETDSDDEL